LFRYIQIESQESVPDESQSQQTSQASFSCIPEESILAAVQEEEASYENDLGDSESDTQRSDESIEYVRSSQEYELSQPDLLNLSQNSLPRRSPDLPAAASPDPGKIKYSIC